MNGIEEYLSFWLIYLAFATVGYWCWQRMFFWLKQTDIKRLFLMLGAVLVYTPAPIAPDSDYFAPAFIVLPFSLIISRSAETSYALNWLLGGLCAGGIMLTVAQLGYWLIRSKRKTGKPR